MTIEDIEDVKTSMRRQEPQAGDASKQAIDKKKKDTSDRAAELMAKQAEAAGVYREGYVTPLRPDKPAGIDIDSDKDIDDESTLGDLISKSMGKGPDSDIQPDVDADHEAEVKFYADRGKKSKEIYEAAQKRRKEKGSRTDSGPGGGPGGPIDPPKSKSLAEENEEIYKQFLPEDVANNPDALKLAAEDAAKKNYEDKYSDKNPRSVDEITKDGEDYTKEVYADGAVFYVRSGDQTTYRGKDEAPTDILQPDPFFPAFEHIKHIKIPKLYRLSQMLDSFEEEGS